MSQKKSSRVLKKPRLSILSPTIHHESITHPSISYRSGKLAQKFWVNWTKKKISLLGATQVSTLRTARTWSKTCKRDFSLKIKTSLNATWDVRMSSLREQQLSTLWMTRLEDRSDSRRKLARTVSRTMRKSTGRRHQTLWSCYNGLLIWNTLYQRRMKSSRIFSVRLLRRSRKDKSIWRRWARIVTKLQQLG